MAEQRIKDASTLSGWRKSSYSGPEGDECVEVLYGYAPGVPVRDSKVPHGPALLVPSTGWTSFLEAVKSSRL